MSILPDRWVIRTHVLLSGRKKPGSHTIFTFEIPRKRLEPDIKQHLKQREAGEFSIAVDRNVIVPDKHSSTFQVRKLELEMSATLKPGMFAGQPKN